MVSLSARLLASDVVCFDPPPSSGSASSLSRSVKKIRVSGAPEQEGTDLVLKSSKMVFPMREAMPWGQKE